MNINSLIPASGRIISESGKVVNIVDILNPTGNVPPISEHVLNIEGYAPRTGRVLGEDGKIYNLVDLLSGGGGGGGTTNHAALNNLDYAKSGHTGFADIYPVDMTARPVPPGFPRTWRWVIGASGTVQGSYNYMRIFYKTLEAAIEDNPDSPDKVAAWSITGKFMQFQKVDENPVVITDASGNVVTPEYRPIPEGEVWFIGDKHPMDGLIPTTPFPTDDTFFSVIEWDVMLTRYLIGELQELGYPNVAEAIKAGGSIPSPRDWPENVEVEFPDGTFGVRMTGEVFMDVSSSDYEHIHLPKTYTRHIRVLANGGNAYCSNYWGWHDRLVGGQNPTFVGDTFAGLALSPFLVSSGAQQHGIGVRLTAPLLTQHRGTWNYDVWVTYWKQPIPEPPAEVVTEIWVDGGFDNATWRITSEPAGLNDVEITPDNNVFSIPNNTVFRVEAINVTPGYGASLNMTWPDGAVSWQSAGTNTWDFTLHKTAEQFEEQQTVYIEFHISD